jgi:CelD/BcsL family acetyltransferase involved in cellulose biosynthesis
MPVELLVESTDAARPGPSSRPKAATQPASSPGEVAHGTETRVVVHAAHALPDALAAEWDDLSSAAVTPNAFYDRWNAVPALAGLTPQADVQLLCIYRGTASSNAAAQLVGLFPLVRSRSSRVSIAVWRLWGHPYCYLQTPLIRRGHERPVLEAVFNWVATQPSGPRIVDWSLIDGEGPFAQALVDVIRERQFVHQVVDRYNRALLRRAADWEQAVASQLSSHHRRELRRQRRRLEEQGQVSVRSLARARDAAYWTDAFLALEAAGWKGTEQTAMGASPAVRNYFTEMVRAGVEAGRVQMLGLFLNDTPVALKVNLHAGDGSFAFKIAYSEALSRFSPGVQLELENVRVLHGETGLQWMDSCAVANHFMINRLWSERRTMQRVLISTGGRLANLAVGGLPLCQALKRSFIKPKLPSAAIDG